MKNIPKNKLVKILGSVLFLVVAIIEIIEEWDQAEIEIQHGAALFAVAHLISVILELYESNKTLHEAIEM